MQDFIHDHIEKDHRCHEIIAQEYDSVVVLPRKVTNNNWKEYLLNYFTHRVTTSVIERINNLIKNSETYGLGISHFLSILSNGFNQFRLAPLEPSKNFL